MQNNDRINCDHETFCKRQNYVAKPILPAEIELFLLYKTPNFLVQGVSTFIGLRIKPHHPVLSFLE
jgi:hypothetical protein